MLSLSGVPHQLLQVADGRALAAAGVDVAAADDVQTAAVWGYAPSLFDGALGPRLAVAPSPPSRATGLLTAEKSSRTCAALTPYGP